MNRAARQVVAECRQRFVPKAFIVEPEDQVDEPFPFPELDRPRADIRPEVGLFDIIGNLYVWGADDAAVVFVVRGNDSLL